ncbi:MAG: oligosaccharide flippase family protein [Acidobacteriia bacterium]|nr:oligosaccharide flippase family protein [Terriglobia bacterium]
MQRAEHGNRLLNATLKVLHAYLPELRSRTLLPDAWWSLTGNLFSVLGGLAALKVIAAFVPNAEFGRASLVLGVIGLLTLFLVNPLLTAHLRLGFDHANGGSADSYYARFRWLLVGVGMLSTICYALIAVIGRWAGNHLYLGLVLPAAMLLFVQPHASATNNYLEAQRRYRPLAFATLLFKAGQVPLLLGLLVTGLSGAYGIILSQALASLALVLVFADRRHPSTQPSVRSSGLEEAQASRGLASRFAGGVYLATFFGWVLTTSDRYVVGHYLSLSAVGIYTMNYGLWSLPYQILNGWLDTVSRSRTYTRAAEGDWQAVSRSLWLRVFAGLAAASAGTILLCFVGRRIALMLVGESYWSSWRLMLLIAAGHIFFVIGSSAVTVLFAAKNTSILSLANLAGATVNVLLNIYLIPRWGIVAAGATTFLSYVLWASILLAGTVSLTRSLKARQEPEPTARLICAARVLAEP